MIDINNYIVEKLKINKDSKTNNFDEINNKFISDIKKYIIKKYPMIKFNSYDEYINYIPRVWANDTTQEYSMDDVQQMVREAVNKILNKQL